MPTNREWATLIWLSLVLGWFIFRGEGWSSIKSVGRALFVPKIIAPLIVYGAYVACLVVIAHGLHGWNRSLTKDTGVWLFTVGLPLLLSLNDASKDGFFGRVAKRTIGLGAFAGFYLNLVTLSLPAELLLQPVLLFATFASVMGKSDPKLRPAKKLSDALLFVIVLGLIFWTARDLASGWDALDKTGTLLSFLLPVWLTLGVLPFIFAFSLLANYELAVIRAGIGAPDKRTPWKARVALVLGFRFSNHDLRSYGGTKAWKLATAKSVRDGLKVVGDYRRSLRETEAAERRAAERLRTYAGVKGVDEEGRQLDQREFKETKDALEWIASCQMGWYQTRAEGYRPEMLDILSNDFTHNGLPTEHGINLAVSKNRKSWFAWRQTVSGWCFAIGAAAAPPDQWRYDGSAPPMSFPGRDPIWGPVPLDQTMNWE